MSTETNTRLYERAQEAISYWEGTMWERILLRDMKAVDLEALKYHVSEAEKEQAVQEDEMGTNG